MTKKRVLSTKQKRSYITPRSKSDEFRPSPRLNQVRGEYKHLLGLMYSNSEITISEWRWFRNKLYSKCISNSTLSMESSDAGKYYLGSMLCVFDCYVVENLKFSELLRHRLRKFRTTILAYIGISTVVVVIK